MILDSSKDVLIAGLAACFLAKKHSFFFNVLRPPHVRGCVGVFFFLVFLVFFVVGSPRVVFFLFLFWRFLMMLVPACKSNPQGIDSYLYPALDPWPPSYA